MNKIQNLNYKILNNHCLRRPKSKEVFSEIFSAKEFLRRNQNFQNLNKTFRNEIPYRNQNLNFPKSKLSKIEFIEFKISQNFSKKIIIHKIKTLKSGLQNQNLQNQNVQNHNF